MKVYKIRRKSDRKFSSGGINPKWTKNGKIWALPFLKNHLHLINDYVIHYKYKNPYENCEIVEYELVKNCVILDDILNNYEFLNLIF